MESQLQPSVGGAACATNHQDIGLPHPPLLPTPEVGGSSSLQGPVGASCMTLPPVEVAQLPPTACTISTDP